jgi:hypothetical protein
MTSKVEMKRQLLLDFWHSVEMAMPTIDEDPIAA